MLIATNHQRHPQQLLRLALAASLLTSQLILAERRILFGTNDGTDHPLLHNENSDLALGMPAMMLPVVLVSRVSAKAQSHVVPFALLWVATLIILRVSIPLVLNKVRSMRDVTISIELDDNSVPSVIKMGVQRKGSNGEEGAALLGSSSQDEANEMVALDGNTLFGESKSGLQSDAMSTISSSTSASSSMASHRSSQSNGSTLSSFASSRASTMSNHNNINRGSVLPDFLKWIEDQPHSSDDSSQGADNRRGLLAFKSRGIRKMRTSNEAVRLRGGGGARHNLIGFDATPRRDAWSLLKSVLPAGLTTSTVGPKGRAGEGVGPKELDNYKPVALRPQRWDFNSSDDSTLELGGKSAAASKCTESTGLYSGHNGRGMRKKSALKDDCFPPRQ